MATCFYSITVFVFLYPLFAASTHQRGSLALSSTSFLGLRSDSAQEASTEVDLGEDTYLVQTLPDGQDDAENARGPVETPVPIFVAIFSARDNWYRRHTVRKGLRHSRHSHPYLQSAKFILCNTEEATKKKAALDLESRKFGDLLLIDCTEGLERTMLTKKLIEAMRVYNNRYAQDFSFFMRVDDDTFVAWSRLQKKLAGSDEYAYLGYSVPAGRQVNRDKNSQWYQPEDSYPAQVYPQYMVKGQGFLLSNALLNVILEQEVATSNILSNEDQAVGVWVDKVKQKGTTVNIVEVAGGEGNPGSKMATTTWGEYPFTLHHRVKSDTINCLATVEASGDLNREIGDCFVDTMFVAVFSARPNFDKRAHVRKTIPYAQGQNKRVAVKFMLCDGQDEYSSSVNEEAHQNNDTIVLPCKEGYARTLMTWKLIATMETFLQKYGDRALFMKVDDDTFVSWSRIRKFMSEQTNSERSYMGILGPNGMKVNRDEASSWYQPPDVYPNETYPPIMEGGPGYILGGELVRRLLAANIPRQHLLSNEDQALGVWMDTLKQRGVTVNMVSLPGTDGYKPEFDTCFGAWEDYPFFLHHKLEPETISCLAQVEQSGNPKAAIDDCFHDCMKLTATALTGRLTDMSSEVQGTISKLRTLELDLEAMMKGVQWMARKIANGTVSGS